MNSLAKLTEKEEEVMTLFWHHGPMAIRDAVALYSEPRPHFNTISTYVHILERKGYLSRHKSGSLLIYTPLIAMEDYSRQTLKGVIHKFFDNSYLKIVSALVKNENISVDELRELIEMVEQSDSGK